MMVSGRVSISLFTCINVDHNLWRNITWMGYNVLKLIHIHITVSYRIHLLSNIFTGHSIWYNIQVVFTIVSWWWSRVFSIPGVILLACWRWWCSDSRFTLVFRCGIFTVCDITTWYFGGDGVFWFRLTSFIKIPTDTEVKNELTHWGRDKMADIFQTTFSNAVSWMKMYKFRLRFDWSLFPRVQLTIFQHWFR